MLHLSHWLVWLIEWIDWIDLPQLQSVKLNGFAFPYCQSVVFESDWLNGLMIQICQNYNPFNLVIRLFMVMIVIIERRLAINPTTTRTHWQWRVRLIERMNEQIFLHSLHSKEIEATSSVSVQWFLRVMICELIEIDIPQLSSDGIGFGDDCFYWTYSLQSSSNPSSLPSSFDAAALESVIRSKSDYL